MDKLTAESQSRIDKKQAKVVKCNGSGYLIADYYLGFVNL
jgi:hypothetical protein